VNAPERQRVLLFLFAGGAAALVNILTRIAFSAIMPYEVAIVVAYVCGMTVAYLLNKYLVFDASGRSITSEYVRFGLVNLLALAQVWIVSVGLTCFVFPAIGFTWYSDTVAHVIGVIVPVFTSYLGHRNFSFAKTGDST
jgi:putative flippase GtrA